MFKFDTVAEPWAGDTLFEDPTSDDYAERLRQTGRRVQVRGGRRYQAQCPCHEDREPSLSISPGTRGKRLVLHCHGCNAGFADLLAAAGFETQRVETQRSPYTRLSVSNGSTGSGHGHRHSHGSQVPENTGDPGPSVAEKFELDQPLFEQIRAYRTGELEPDFDVRLPLDRLPSNARTLRSAAKWVSVIMGFRLTDGDTGPAPISTSLLAWAMGLDPDRGKPKASLWLHSLERHRVIRQDGEVPMLGKGNGIRCFQPFDRDLATEFDLSNVGHLLDELDLAPLDV